MQSDDSVGSSWLGRVIRLLRLVFLVRLGRRHHFVFHAAFQPPVLSILV